VLAVASLLCLAVAPGPEFDMAKFKETYVRDGTTRCRCRSQHRPVPRNARLRALRRCFSTECSAKTCRCAVHRRPHTPTGQSEARPPARGVCRPSIERLCQTVCAAISLPANRELG